MITLNLKQAEARGYRALTTKYYLPREQWMLDRVVGDMKRASVDHVLVRETGGVSVWRRAPGNEGCRVKNAECRRVAA